MKRTQIRLRAAFLLLTLVLLGAQAATAQLTPSEAASQMGRGINMGNTLEPETEGGWNNPPAREELFDYYVDAGFKTVRVPVRWDKHTGTTTPFAVQASWMDRVEEIVDWGLERDLFVIINTHHDDWIKSGYDDPVKRARFDAIWVQIAERFKDKSDKLMLEIINEPFGISRAGVDDLNARVLDIIRATNPTRLVIFSGNEYSGAEQLMAAAIPDDPWLMAYYHSYDPWSFAGEGQGTWGASDRAALKARVQQVADWSATHGIPVIMSEFGTVREADYNSRMRFYSAYVEEHLAAGMPFQVWDDGGWFRVLHRDDGTWNDEKDLLMHAYIDGPTEISARVDQDTTVVLSWTNRSAQFGGIRVERAVADGPFEPLGSVNASVSSFVDTDVTGNTSYRYRVIALNALRGDRYSPPFQILVPAFARSSFGGLPASIPGVVEAEHFDIGGEGISYHDVDAVNQGQVFRTSEGVDIVSFTAGSLQVGYLATGEWLEYTVDVAETGLYDVVTDVSSVDGTGFFQLSLGDVRTTRLQVPATGAWDVTAPVTASMDLNAGKQILRFSVVLSRPFNVDRITFSKVGSTATEYGPANPDAPFIYPNPVLDTAQFTGPEDGRVHVFDMRGRLVQSAELGRKMRIGGFSSGTYVARFTTRTGEPAGTVPFVVL